MSEKGEKKDEEVINVRGLDEQPSAAPDIESDSDLEDASFQYNGVETSHTFEAMYEANELIGGANVVNKDANGKKKEYKFISLEDVDDADTNELKNYNVYNKDHKIFQFSLPMGANNHTSSDPITMLKTMMPKVDDTAEDRIFELKAKLKHTGTLNSQEELELFQKETGAANARSAAIKQTMGMDGLKQSFQQFTIDGNEKTSDGYVIRRLETIYDELEGDIVIMGGYRGSILRDRKTNRRIWVPLKAGLNLTKIDLLIGPKEGDEDIAEKTLYPDGMLTHVGPVDISKKLIKKLDSNPKVNIQEFGYDWRLSLDRSAKHLRDLLQKNYDKQKEKKGTYVIAHSMGGLVAHKVLQDYTHLVRGIIYVGSPSQCSNILGPIRFGDEVMWNKSILSKEANFFMRSSFYFLPLDGRCFIDKKTLKRYDVDFFDPKAWMELGLSPLISDRRLKYIESTRHTPKEKSNFLKEASGNVFNTLGATTKFVMNNVPIVNKVSKESAYIETIKDDSEFKTSYEDSVEYLKRTLAKTKEYAESLEYIPGKEYPPLAIVYGNKVPTVRGCKVDGIKDIVDGRYDDFYYGPGDGVVHYKWLLPERKGFPVVCKVASDTGHVSLMTDLNSIAKAFISIVEAEKQIEEEKKGIREDYPTTCDKS